MWKNDWTIYNKNDSLINQWPLNVKKKLLFSNYTIVPMSLYVCRHVCIVIEMRYMNGGSYIMCSGSVWELGWMCFDNSSLDPLQSRNNPSKSSTCRSFSVNALSSFFPSLVVIIQCLAEITDNNICKC